MFGRLCSIQSLLIVVVFVSFYVAFSLYPREVKYLTKDGRYLLDEKFYKEAKPAAIFSLAEAVLGLLPNRLLSLDLETLKTDAGWRCGAKEFWSHPYGEKAIKALLSAIETDKPPLTYLGTMMLRENFISWLCVQSQVNRLLKENPEIEREEIRSVVIAGAPRTGSTHMLSMLCKHPNATCLTFAESLAPIASVSGQDILSWKDFRLYYSKIASAIVLTIRPLFKHMFKFGALQPMEELQLGAIAFGSSIFLTNMYLPSYEKWFMENDHTPMEEYVRTLLKVIQYQRGGERKLWILKSPQNADQLGPKMRVFPQANVVFMHREALPVLQSVIGMVCYTVGVFNKVDQVDYKKLARLWLNHQSWSQVEGMSRENVERHIRPLSKLMNIKFKDFMEDTVGTALSVAKHAGLEVNDSIRDIFTRFQQESPQEGSKVLKYDIHSLGIQDEEVKRLFEPYEQLYLQ